MALLARSFATLRKRPFRWMGIVAAFLLAAVTAFAVAVGFFNSDPLYIYGLGAKPKPVAAIYFSGDMGLRFGIGSYVAPALAARGIPVLGFSSPALFTQERTQADVNRILADAITTAVRRTGATRIVLIGQSFGSDVVASGLPSLPVAQRRHLAAVVLVVPGETAYFRADPSGLRYNGTPDARPGPSLRRIDWTPIVCIYGNRERDSLCPSLVGSKASVIALSGGHFLNNDPHRLTATILHAIHAADPNLLEKIS